VTLETPVLCLITDRRRLAERVGCDPDSPEAIDALTVQVRAAAGAGVGLVQLREPEVSGGRLVELARTLRQALAPSGARLVINDRIDAVLASGADGVHLKVTSIPPADARRLLGDSALVGQSVHADAPMCTSDRVDYVVFGTVFPTASKPDGWTTVGATALAQAVRASGGRPVLAIGGITVETAGLVARAGAAGLAAIAAFLPGQGAPIAESVHARVRALRIAFDSTTPVSYDGGNG